jgi:CubicO group peptidase (beta-lactamase class C family)
MTTIEALADVAFDDSPANPLATTQALAVMRNGEIVFERYADGFDTASTFISWSMAKSMTAALCGVLVDRGEIDIDAPAPIAEWQGDDDPRRAITLRNLLEMRSGLAWNEDYVDDQVSDVIEMLFGSGKHDIASYAASKPLEHEPGTHFYYSSGTTNLIARILGDHLGGRDAMEAALQDELFRPAGMTNSIPKFDEAGTFVGSSFVYAPVRDFLAFGELFRNGGMAGEQRVLSQAWVDASVLEHSVDDESGQGYGLQWWLARDEFGSFCCNGYEGQRIQVVPSLGLTFVRVGKTDAAYSDDLRAFYAQVAQAFA